MTFRHAFLLLRPQQWVKNLFIFLPLFFDRGFGDPALLTVSFAAFAAFSLAASSIYCFNDIRDVEADRLHEKKRHRPIASGEVAVTTAWAMMLTSLTAAVACLFLLPERARISVGAVIGFYYVMNLAYCVKLKHLALVDVFIIATGFVLRILAGGFATGVWISEWIVLMTFLLALFLAFAKRRDDVVIYASTNVKARRNINRYNLEFMNQSISIVAAITMVCYMMYTLSPEVIARMQSPYLYVSSVWVLAGIIRYLQLTIVDVKSGSPTRVLLHDRFVQACIVGWLLTFTLILYL